MHTPSKHIRVPMPDHSFFDVTFYCDDTKLSAKDKQSSTQLFIQHHDCLCVIQIKKSLSRNMLALENVVHNRVLNTKGHLC